MNANKSYINCFEHVSLQLIGDNEVFDTQLFVRFNPQAREIAPVVAPVLASEDSAAVADTPDEVIIGDINAKVQTEYYPDGTKKREVETRDGFKHGDYREYHPNGRIKVRGRYRNDKADGTWRYYDTNGREIDKKHFEEGIEKR
jgi:hypothetical protein